MGNIFNFFVYEPIYNTLIFLYNVIPGGDFGVAIIIFTLIIKAGLYPISKKQIESQKKLQELQPQIKALQEKYKDDKEKQTRELLDFYKKNKTNPFSGCLPIIIQLIFFFAIYRVLFNISSSDMAITEKLYSFIHNPGTINHHFLSIIDLAKPNAFLAVFAAAAQFFQTKDLMSRNEKNNGKKAKDLKNESTENKQPDFTEVMNKQMIYLGPFITLLVGLQFAAGLSLYWLISTLFSFFQQIYIRK